MIALLSVVVAGSASCPSSGCVLSVDISFMSLPVDCPTLGLAFDGCLVPG